MLSTSTLLLSLVALGHAAPYNNDGGSKSSGYIDTQALLSQIYESDLREGAAVLQGLAVEGYGNRSIGTPG